MRFAELTDEQWDFIKPRIPPQPIVGRKRADDRKTINGILYVLVTGCRWHDMPRRYGSYQTAWRRLNWWSKIGVWNKILSAAQEYSYAIGKLNLEIVAVDSTLIDSKKVASQHDTMVTRDAKEQRSMLPSVQNPCLLR
jgi:transposase